MTTTHRLLTFLALSAALMLGACGPGADAQAPSSSEQAAAAPAEAAPAEAEEAAAEQEPAAAAAPSDESPDHHHPHGYEGEIDDSAPVPDSAHAHNMDSAHAPSVDVPDDELVRQPGASLGDPTRCPVSKETFRVAEDSASVEYEGETVYFCCGSCIRRFLRDPAGHLEDQAG